MQYLYSSLYIFHKDKVIDIDRKCRLISTVYIIVKGYIFYLRFQRRLLRYIKGI